MDEKPKERGIISEAQLLLKPKAIGKIAASCVPVIGGVIGGMISEIEGQRVDDRLTSVEQNLREMQQLERQLPESAPSDAWSVAAKEYYFRTIDLAVSYDGGFHSEAEKGQMAIQSVAHACLINEGEAIAPTEALSLANNVARHKKGQVVILRGMAWYSFKEGPVDGASGLQLLSNLVRNESLWSEYLDICKSEELAEPAIPVVEPVNVSMNPFPGQQVGFFHSGEVTRTAGLDHFEHRQFDGATISHIKFPERGGIKRFVSGPIGSRVLKVGSPVFGRDGALLGMISDVEWLENDFGRRIVARSFLGHPRFSPASKRP